MSPGQRDRAAGELDTAATALREAAALLDAGFVLGAISRLYYAVFHGARAALLVHGRHSKTHKGQITQFKATFGSDSLPAELLEKRIVADYKSPEFDTDEAEARALVARASEFVERCRTIVAAEVARGVNDPNPPPDY